MVLTADPRTVGPHAAPLAVSEHRSAARLRNRKRFGVSVAVGGIARRSCLPAARTATGSPARYSTVFSTPSRIVSFGFQPSARMRRRVQEDERAVADPPAVAAGVGQRRASRPAAPQIQPIESFTSAYFVGAEVEHVDRVVRHLSDRDQHRVDAVLHVEIALALLAVAEDVKLRRVVAELACRSRRRGRGCSARRGSRRSGRCSPEIRSPRSTPGSALRRRACGAVERGLQRETARPPASGRSPARRRSSRSTEKPIRLHAVRAHRFEHVEVAIVFCSRSRSRVLRAEAHVGVGGEMKDEVVPASPPWPRGCRPARCRAGRLRPAEIRAPSSVGEEPRPGRSRGCRKR